MELMVEKLGDIGVVTPVGKHLDASDVQAFKQGMKPVLKDHRQVVLDLENLAFIDSSGIGALLSCLRTLNDAGGDLKVCNVSNPVRTIFELVRLHRILEIFNTREEALRAYRRVAETA